MRLLLDTHCWLWMQVSPEVFAPQVREILEGRHHELLLSSASVWEISIKWSLGKLPLPEPLATYTVCVGGRGLGVGDGVLGVSEWDSGSRASRPPGTPTADTSRSQGTSVAVSADGSSTGLIGADADNGSMGATWVFRL